MLMLLTFTVVVVGLCLWVNDCNLKTNTQLMVCLANLTHAVSTKSITQTEFNACLDELDKTSYFNHMMHLVTFRDPRDLYSTRLKKFF